MKTKITKKDKLEAAKMIELITPIEGEKRTINKCCECGQLFGRRFISFGFGYGLSINMCMCQLTGHRDSVLVVESAP